jgi:hypothetical protein
MRAIAHGLHSQKGPVFVSMLCFIVLRFLIILSLNLCFVAEGQGDNSM